MATKQSKGKGKSGGTPTRATLIGNRLTIVFGDENDIVLETEDDRYKGTLEDFGVLPTLEDILEALEEFPES